jgi:hypothetical protein
MSSDARRPSTSCRCVMSTVRSVFWTTEHGCTGQFQANKTNSRFRSPRTQDRLCPPCSPGASGQVKLPALRIIVEQHPVIFLDSCMGTRLLGDFSA